MVSNTMKSGSILDQMYRSQPIRLSHPSDVSFSHTDFTRFHISQSQVHPTSTSPSDLGSTWVNSAKQTSIDNSQPRQCLKPMWKYRLQGLAFGIVVGVAMIGLSLGLALGLTKPCEGKGSSAVDASTQAPITYTCGSLRWSTVGTVVVANGGYGNASHQLMSPYGIFVDSNNIIYIADSSNHRIQRWLPNATNGTTVAGMTGVCMQNDSGLCYPRTIYVDTQQYVYIADNYGVRRWSLGGSSGILYTGSSSLSWVYGIDMDRNGNLYVCATNRYSIMMWSSPTNSPIIVAGGNGWGFSLSNLNYPYGLAIDPTTNTLYTANNGMHNVMSWRINASSGTIVAGRNGTFGVNAYTLRYPTDVKLDTLGNLYILDSDNNRVVMKCAGSPDLVLKSVIDEGLWYIRSVALDSQMNIYILDGNYNQILKYNRLP